MQNKKIMSTSSIIHIPFEKSVCERNIKCCNYIKADRKKDRQIEKGMIFQDFLGPVAYNVLQEFEAKMSAKKK